MNFSNSGEDNRCFEAKLTYIGGPLSSETNVNADLVVLHKVLPSGHPVEQVLDVIEHTPLQTFVPVKQHCWPKEMH